MKHLRIHRGQTVNVFMDGVTLQGVLADAHSDGVVLHKTRVLAEGVQEPQSAPGVVHVPAGSIVWVQVVVK